MRTTAALALVAALALAACGDDAQEVDSSAPDVDGSPTSPVPSTPGTVPEGATPGGTESGLFVEVRSGGGFAPALFDVRQLPQAVVYADGTVFAPGAITLQYPGPAVLPVFRGTVDEATLDGLLAAAAEAGLLADDLPALGDQGDLPIADATTTTVTVVVDGEEHVVDAYALYEADGPGLDAEQRAARAALQAFVDAATEVVAAAAEPYDPERYRVVAGRPAAAGAGGDVDPAVNELAWPDGLPLPVAGECIAVAGDGVAALEALLPDATEVTRWLVAGQPVSLAIRPVLPHEPDCA